MRLTFDPQMGAPACLHELPRSRMGTTATAAADELTIAWSPFAIASSAEQSAGRRAPVRPNQVIAGRYRVSRLLGSGATGSVWLAHDEVLRRAVALKQLHAPPTSTFTALAEARAAAQVAHPGIVRVHDVIVGDGCDWIVMEALAGKTLSETILERGRLSIGAVADIGLQLLSALQAIHDADLVHGDVKPGNIQMCDGDHAVLTDFGLSSPPAVLGGVSVGTVRGSLPYIAPETIIHGAVGPASDLYALGVTLYTAVEGRRPFDPGTPVTLMESALERMPTEPHHAGRGLSDVLAGLLHNDPSRRLDAAASRTRLQLIEAGVEGVGMARAG